MTFTSKKLTSARLCRTGEATGLLLIGTTRVPRGDLQTAWPKWLRFEKNWEKRPGIFYQQVLVS